MRCALPLCLLNYTTMELKIVHEDQEPQTMRSRIDWLCVYASHHPPTLSCKCIGNAAVIMAAHTSSTVRDICRHSRLGAWAAPCRILAGDLLAQDMVAAEAPSSQYGLRRATACMAQAMQCSAKTSAASTSLQRPLHKITRHGIDHDHPG